MELFDDEKVDDYDIGGLPGIEDSRLTKEELRNVRSRLRSQINRDSANSEKRAAAAARDMISRSELYSSEHYRKSQELARRDNAIAYGTAAVASRVLNSMGVNVPVKVDTIERSNEPPVTAFTNFESIHVRINLKHYNEADFDSMVKLLHNVKGIVYHEGGHILFTHSFFDMVQAVHKARNAYCSEYGTFPSTHGYKGDILRLAVDREWLTLEQYNMIMNPDVKVDIRMVMRAWNVLEDQRMETAMVNTSPVMARYFTEIVINNVIIPGREASAYPWIIGRTYLPKNVRQFARSMAETLPQSEILPVMEKIIMQYRRSNDLFEMYDLCIDFAECLVVWQNGKNDGGGQPGDHGSSQYPHARKGTPSPVPDPDNSSIEQPNPTEGSEQASENSNPDNDKDQNDHVDETPPSTESVAGKPDKDSPSTADRNTNSSLREMLDDFLKREESDTNINEVSEFLSTVNDAKNALVMPNQSIQTMIDDEIAKSVLVTNSMRDVLDKLVVQVDPSWVFYQEHGVLDPVAFEMREPGDSNYWSGLDGAGSNGHDISITMLLDTSGSMGAFDTELSVAAMGIRKACEQLNIPCTILTFSDDVRMVAEGDKDTNYVRVSAVGGTEISSAMHVINNFRYGKTHHLVVILTDGEWSDIKDLRSFSEPGRHTMLIGFNIDDHYLANKGADSRAVITDLAQLPAKVTHALAGYLM